MTDLLARWRAEVDAHLQQLLCRADVTPRLAEACHYSVFNGGKRLRPMLVCAAAHLRGGDAAAALAPAAAVELIHAYSLVHDDLPAMDDDDLRRGRPTCHKQFDEATAILVGDALQALAFELIATEDALSAPSRVAMLRTLASAAGRSGMVGGQMLDMQSEGVELDQQRLEQIHRGKTGALIQASVQLGALVAGPLNDDEQAHLTTYGSAIGLGFQIIDDVLDATASAQQLGKTPGKDAAAGKNTYVQFLGIDGARQRARQLLDDVGGALAHWQETAAPLRELARQAIDRDR